jgi:hypothetical protein
VPSVIYFYNQDGLLFPRPFILLSIPILLQVAVTNEEIDRRTVAKIEVLMAVTVKITVFWDVMAYSLVVH